MEPLYGICTFLCQITHNKQGERDRDVVEVSDYEPRDDQQSRQQTEQGQDRLEEQDGIKPRVLSEESQGGELERRNGLINELFFMSD